MCDAGEAVVGVGDVIVVGARGVVPVFAGLASEAVEVVGDLPPVFIPPVSTVVDRLDPVAAERRLDQAG